MLRQFITLREKSLRAQHAYSSIPYLAHKEDH